jgi:hypothetical protein
MNTMRNARLPAVFCMSALAIVGAAKLYPTAQADSISRTVRLYASKSPNEQVNPLQLPSASVLQQNNAAAPQNASGGVIQGSIGDYISIHRRLAP